MSVLDEILSGVREDLAAREEQVPLDELKRRVEIVPDPIDALAVLRQGGVGVIAEVKRSSPSRGSLAPIDDPAHLAQAYESGGARCISVLTEQRRFGGSLEDLAAVRAAVDVPVLRKDFIVTSYQLWEARCLRRRPGPADRGCPRATGTGLARRARGVHRAAAVGRGSRREEVQRAVDAGAKVIGVNARDLRTLEVDLGVFERVAPSIPEGIVRIAESGVKSPQDLLAYAAAGADAVLVGEALVTQADPAAAVQDLVSAGEHPAVRHAD